MVYNIIQELASTNSRIEKEKILQTHKNNAILQRVFKYAYNPHFNYYLRNLRSYNLSCDSGAQDNYEAMFDVLDLLKTRVHTGHSAVSYCTQFINKSSPSVGEVFLRILERDMNCGVQTATVNKIWPNNIVKFECMLAQKGRPTFPCLAEEKYDGVRIIAFVHSAYVDFFTRNGQQIELPKLEYELLKNKRQFPIVLDGELIGINRQSCSGIVNKFIKKTARPDEEDNFIFNIFDGMSLVHWEQRFSDVYNERKDFIWFHFTLPSERYKLVESRKVFNQEDIDTFYAEIIETGGEGLIIKREDHLYEWKRSKNWLKLKEENTIDLEVVEVLPGVGKRADSIGSLLCVSSCSRLSVRVGSGLTDVDILEMQENSPIGKIAEIKYNVISYNQNDESLSLFLPRFVCLRPDKTEADWIE